VIRVDAVDQGNGGEAIVWADGRTDFAGTITAKGGANGGDGGFVEVSGKESLGFTGTVDTTAINGATGTLLLDPTDILIVDGSFGSGDSEFSTLGGTVSSTYTPSSEPFTISELTIESFLLSSDVSLAATNNITIADLTDNFLGFSSGSGNLTLTADADNSGAGSVIMDSSDTIAIGGSINISGASLNLGGLSTDGSDIQLTSTNGDITLTNQINTSRFSLNAGNITIESSGTIDASGESSFTLNNDVNNLGEEYTLNTSSDNGVGGNVTLTAVGDITLGLIDTSGSLGGGNISMNSTGGNVNAIVSSVPVSVESATGTANVGILDSSSDQGDGGTVNLRAAGNVTVGSILSGSIDGAGGDVTLSSSTGGVTAISTGTLTSSSGVSETSSAGGIATGTTGSGQGGNITITAPGDIRTGWLLTGNIGSSGLQGGGNVRLTSTGGSIDTTINVTDIDAGLLVDLGLTSAQATLASQAGTELGMIITGSQDGNGGTVNLSAAGDIRTGAIVSGSQNATGGTVTLTSSGGSIDTSNDAFFSGLTEQAWLEGASAAGLEPTDTIDFAQDLGFGTGVYTVGELATILDGFSFRLGIITGSENGTGADVTLQAAGNVTTSNILTTSLDGNSGNISITSSGGAINGQEGVLLSGVNADLLQSLGLGADLSTVLGYLSDPDVAFGGYITLSLNGNAGNITLNAAGDVLTNYLATSSFSGRPGNITINSGGNVVVGRLLSNIANGIFPAEFSNLTDDRADQLADLISRGVLNSSGATSGGNIDIQATTSITTGAVNSSSTLGSGGSVFLDPEGDIEVYSINAQGGTQLGSSSSGVSGGDVTIVTQSNFRALGSFTDQNGIDASISTAAPGQIVFSESESGSSTLQPGNGGRISISHGGNGTTPFTIGRALSSGSGNGVVGAITSGNFTIFPYNIDPTTAASLANGNPFLIAPESGYFFTERFPLDGFDNAIGSIGIFSVDRPNVICEGGGCEPPPKTCDELGICGQPGGGISEDGQVLSIDEARDILALIEQRSGVKPALIYVSFEAPDFILQRQAAAVEFERDEARFSEQYEQHLNVPDRFQGSPLQIAPSDRDILQLLVVTSSEEPFLVSVPDATRERVLFNGGRMIDAIIDQEPEGVYLRSSQQLYSQLVAPISAALEEREVENLVFIMDNSLRLLPVAALHDGEQYLIEKYSVGLMPSLSLTDTRFVDIKEVGLLAMGADTFSDEAPLPSVPTELSVISELWNAPEPLLNNRFTLENLRSARSNQRYGILHLATHGDFNPGAANQSYIRFGDRRVTLDQLRTLRLYDPTVELMVLSACRTAVGNPDAELGFAGLAHQAGVKTALGSLWYVGDQATLGLMTSFYDSLRTAPIKAEALRQAQLAMLRGEINLKDGAINIENSDAPALQFPLRGEVIEALEALPVDLRHPYAWSAFTMIGSPW
jgi:CHAT domain-containing protein